jgi:hypothetical protein
VGVPNGPVFVWFLATISRFTLDPVVGTMVIVLVNVAALAFAVPLFRRLLPGRGEAELALALYATNPVAIWHSRKLWDPCLVPLFAVPALALAARVLQGRGSWALAGLIPLLALAGQTHQSGALFGIVLVATLLSDPRRLGPAPLGVGVAGGVLLAAPYALHLVREIFGRPGGFAPVTTSRLPDIDVVTNLLLDASGHNILQAASRDAGWLLLWPFPPLGLLVQLAAIPFYVYLIAGYVGAVRGEAGLPRKTREAPTAGGPSSADTATRRSPAGDLSARASFPPGARRLLLGLGLGLPALYLVMRVRGVAHYFLAIFPLLSALIVVGARRIRGMAPRRRRWVPPLPVLLGVHVLSWILFQSYMSSHSGSDGYGLPYGELTRACEEVAERAAEIGRGTEDAPLRLAVDVPRDRGVIPHQYAFVLRHRLGVEVEPPAEGAEPDLVLRVRWERPRGEPVWEVMPGGGPG